MLTCREVTRRIGTDEVAGSSIWGRLSIRIHLIPCKNCRRFAQQMRVLGAFARRSWGGEPEDPAAIGHLEERILGRLPSRTSSPTGSGAADMPPGSKDPDRAP